jgi:hypothetical protein
MQNLGSALAQSWRCTPTEVQLAVRPLVHTCGGAPADMLPAWRSDRCWSFTCCQRASMDDAFVWLAISVLFLQSARLHVWVALPVQVPGGWLREEAMLQLHQPWTAVTWRCCLSVVSPGKHPGRSPTPFSKTAPRITRHAQMVCVLSSTALSGQLRVCCGGECVCLCSGAWWWRLHACWLQTEPGQPATQCLVPSATCSFLCRGHAATASNVCSSSPCTCSRFCTSR